MADVFVPYEGTEPYIFISYSHKDFDAITPILRIMQDEGYRFWYDEGIHGSDTWDNVVAAHVRNCGFFIAFITGNYIKSEVCNDELGWARVHQKEITLIYMENVQLAEGLDMRLNRVQAIYLPTCQSRESFYNRLFHPEKMDLCCEKKISRKKISQDEVLQLSNEEMVLMGEMYLTGSGTDLNYDKAISYFTRAADNGSDDARFRLGRCYENGFGVSRDPKMAFEQYQAAAREGNIKAQCKVALCYHNGQGTKKDEAQYIAWYTKAAEQGCVEAQYALGEIYETGKGAEKDEAKAFEWYSKAADSGNADAQYWLGIKVGNGEGSPRDLLRAFHLFGLAAGQRTS